MKRKLVFFLIPAGALLLLLTLAFQLSFVKQLISRLPFHSLTAKTGADRAMPKAPYLSPTEQEIVAEINLARADPRDYAAHLEELKQRYDGKTCRRPGSLNIETSEGASAVDEAINFLRSASAEPPLDISRGMSLGAKVHVEDLGPKGGTGHKGTDASFVEQRINRFGNWRDAVGETIAYDKGTARDIVMGFIVDDGVANRNHRKAIFSPAYHTAGVACGDHTSLGKMCVVTYAGAFSESGTQTVATKF